MSTQEVVNFWAGFSKSASDHSVFDPLFSNKKEEPTRRFWGKFKVKQSIVDPVEASRDVEPDVFWGH